MPPTRRSAIALVLVLAAVAGLHACDDSSPTTGPAAPARVAAASAVAGTDGEWQGSYRAPVVAIHMHLLPTGKVMLWGHKGDAYEWNPASPGGFARVANPYEIFCGGHAFLPDGRLLVVGGELNGERGLPKAAVFDPVAGRWSSTASMARGRYYPSAVTLPDGEVLVLGGTDEQDLQVTIPEVWSGGGWRRLTSASLEVPFYPTTFVAPNGKVFMAGPGTTSMYLSTAGTGGWSRVAKRKSGRTAGSAVMYAPGKILIAGGGDPPQETAEVIDLNRPSPAWRAVAPMRFARRHMDATLLADGQVLVTHGTSGPGSNNIPGAVHYAELWNPATEQWRTLAREPIGRVYHSTAALLPDGRVLSGGTGEGGGVSWARSEFTIQVYSPPYLFNPDGSAAARPRIAAAPATLAYGKAFAVETPDASTVSRGTLIRLSSVTHTFNESQRIYPLTFSASSGHLSAIAPRDGTAAPPGPYLLFLVNAKGVPSVARKVRVGP